MKIDIPKKITARQEELLREFDAESNRRREVVVFRDAWRMRLKDKKTDAKDEDSHDKKEEKKLNDGNKIIWEFDINKQQVYEGIKRNYMSILIRTMT
ncbi:MAG TPA: hypothetical protein VMW91_07580 [Desulfosporosinus sp.]|nr:hypothetical protein [Desulfosporosinus sp.]